MLPGKTCRRPKSGLAGPALAVLALWMAAGIVARATPVEAAGGKSQVAASGVAAFASQGPGDPAVPAYPPLSFEGRGVPQVAPSVHGFQIVGLLQTATVSGAGCPAGATAGGMATVNGQTVTIPCNTIVQLPTNTMSWADLFTAPAAQLALDSERGPEPQTIAAPAFKYAGIEIRVVGNFVDGAAIAGLVSISQPSGTKGKGYITGFDYANGVIFVGHAPSGPSMVRLELNDPKIVDAGDPAFGTGRFSAGQSPDVRFQADQANPSVRSATGYPMCIPRISGAVIGPNGETSQGGDDPRCPNRNRPLAGSAACRSFAEAGIDGVGGSRAIDTTSSAEAVAFDGAAPWCRRFVMKYAPEMAGKVVLVNGVAKKITAGDVASALGNAEPDSRMMAPLKIGDRITYSGLVLKGSANGPALVGTNTRGDTISVHTIEANVGIYTSPGSLPVYVAINEFSVSADSSASPVSVTGIPQVVSNRLGLDAVVTDVQAIVDAYFVDIEPAASRQFIARGIAPGTESQRWITPNAITGEVGAPGSHGMSISGGVTTQLTGRQPGQVRVRALKVNPGTLVSPTRYVRVVARTLCDPANVNGAAEQMIAVAAGATTSVSCLKRAYAANGLYSGQFLMPVTTYVFPEAALAGDADVPYDFWSLGFLVNGEGGTGTAGDTLQRGPLVPSPW